jgi:hypothetical protein
LKTYGNGQNSDESEEKDCLGHFISLRKKLDFLAGKRRERI